MNILGIDYGKKRIGLAWTDSDMDVILPYGVIDHGDWELELITLIDEEKIDRIVIGMPYSLDGGENENTKRVHEFWENLRKHVDIPIDFVDERFSSKQADKTPGDVSRDEKAAMIILQSHIDSQSHES